MIKGNWSNLSNQIDFPDILVKTIASDSLLKIDSWQRGSIFNEDSLDPLDLAFKNAIFKQEGVNPFLENKVIAYHNEGIEKCFNFLINYVFFMNFEGKI